MKIAMMVRGYIPAPRPVDIVYTPIDLAVEIAEGLAKRGHEIDFYGPAGTRLKVPVKTRGLRALAHNYKEFQGLLTSVDLLTHYVPGLWDQYLSGEMFRRATKGDYDILHFHHPETAMPYANLFPTVPVAYTLHDPIYGWYHEMFHLYHSPNQFYISISDNQRKSAPELPYAATAYNGIDISRFKFTEKHDDYLLYVGRIIPEKGVVDAIDVAEATGHRLIIIGPTYDDKRAYFDDYIKPRLNEKIIYLGYLDNDKVISYFAHAKAFLNPIQWEEPFGVTMIEAMACGTPVIAYKRGSIPEIVTNNKTGFVVNTKRQMIAAVKKIDTINRRDCREQVEARFSIEKMLDHYEAAFLKIVKEQRRKRLPDKLMSKKLRAPKWLPAHIKANSKK
jgi:glycosyltransferase involved in cell wall biosynthesis